MRTSDPDNFPLKDTEFVSMLALLMALQALGIDAMLPALGVITDQLGVTDANDRQLIVGTYLMGMGLGSLIFGFLADRFGRKPVILSTVSAYCALSLACVIVGDFATLLVLRFLNGAFSAAGVVAMAVVRDRYEGDRMARTISLVAMVFMVVPILAPILGQIILDLAGWRAIFGLLAAMSAIMFVWIGLRLPETLQHSERQPLQLARIGRNLVTVVRNRDAAGYVLGSTLVMGGLYGFINVAQQLIAEHFGLGSRFPYVFAVLALSMSVTNFINSRIVERFGARPVGHIALIVFVLAGAAQLTAAEVAPDSFALFVPIMAINMALIGFLGANFSAIALQPFARIAGSASSLQMAVRIGLGAVLGSIAGAAYDGTARALGASLLAFSLLGLCAVLYSERGRLFRRRAGAIELV